MSTDDYSPHEKDNDRDITHATAEEMKDLDSDPSENDNPPDINDSSVSVGSQTSGTLASTVRSSHQNTSFVTSQLHLSKLKYKGKSRKQNWASMIQTIAGVSGNVLEWYDFAVFGCLADIIGKNLMPPQDDQNQLVQSIAVFGIAFFTRPSGGMLMGYMGDKYGRKLALEISIFLTAFSTILMGLLPTYAMIGWPATALFALVRLLQGLAVGGQLPSSLVFTLEHQTYENWGLYGGYVMASANFGTLVGSFVASSMKIYMAEENLLRWGWRIPYLSGILLAIPGLYLRYYCIDYTKDHLGPEAPGWNPLPFVFASKNARALLSASLVPSLWSTGFYVTFIWMPNFLEDDVGFRFMTASLINSVNLFLVGCVFFPVAGWASDWYGKKRVMYCGARYLLFGSPAAVVCIGKGNVTAASIAQIAMGVCLAMWGAPMMAWLVESFPAHIRLTSIGVSYNIAMAIFGGSSYVLITPLTKLCGNETPGFVISGVAALGMIGLYFRPRRSGQKDRTPCDECETLCF